MKRSTKSSTRPETFVDTSGFYALLVKKDGSHERARAFVEQAARSGGRFITTDYILDETATLLKGRRRAHLAQALFETVFMSAACRVEWMEPDGFARTKAFFLKHHDQEWSFTDCFSFSVMRRLGLRDALTADAHFRRVGFNPLLV